MRPHCRSWIEGYSGTTDAKQGNELPWKRKATVSPCEVEKLEEDTVL